MARSPAGNQESGRSVNFPDAEDDRYDFLFKVGSIICVIGRVRFCGLSAGPFRAGC